MRVKHSIRVPRLQFEQMVAAKQTEDYLAHLTNALAREWGAEVMRQQEKKPEFLNESPTQLSEYVIISFNRVVLGQVELNRMLHNQRSQGYAEGLAVGKSEAITQVRKRWAAMGEQLLANKVIG